LPATERICAVKINIPLDIILFIGIFKEKTGGGDGSENSCRQYQTPQNRKAAQPEKAV
jgi:hypothetical protein